jgi:hypothetical protein
MGPLHTIYLKLDTWRILSYLNAFSVIKSIQ